jgi:hypothetical protein
MYMDTEKKNKKVQVSSEFIKCYEHFNVFDVISDIKKLDKRELYLLLMLCVDNHDDNNTIVLQNFSEFKEELNEILDLQENEETTNEFLLALTLETCDTAIDIENIVCVDGGNIKAPFTKDEIRDIKIDKIDSI